MQNNSVSLSDDQLIEEIKTLVSDECKTLAKLVSLLAEMDERKLFAQLGYSSLFGYMMKVLHFSESAAYKRINAARLSKQYPVVISLIAAGKVNLTVINLLRLSSPSA